VNQTAGLLDSRPRRFRPIDLNALVSPILGLAVVLLALFLGFALVALFLQNRRIAALEQRLARLTRGSEGGNLQDVLESHLDTVARVSGDVDELSDRTARLESQGRRAFQRIGLVRFNPFEDTGSNQSFALALLDGRDDGIVISSLHSRSATRIYAKALSAGRADAALSDEESQAVEIARSAPRRAPSGLVEPPAGASSPPSVPPPPSTDLRSGGGPRPGLGDSPGLAQERPSV
jgi:hypothetical protein